MRFLPSVLAAVLVMCAPQMVAAQGAYPGLDGTGDQVSEPLSLESGLHMVAIVHEGDGYFAVRLHRGDRTELLVNAVGRYEGGILLPVEGGSHRFEVNADGFWAVVYDRLEPSAVGVLPPAGYEGVGDMPLGPIELPQGLLIASVTHNGSGYFSATLYHAEGRRAGLLMNHVGAYQGTVAHRVRSAGAYYLQISADGEWSVSLELDG